MLQILEREPRIAYIGQSFVELIVDDLRGHE
jgi:hypothetical protein